MYYINAYIKIVCEECNIEKIILKKSATNKFQFISTTAKDWLFLDYVINLVYKM